MVADTSHSGRPRNNFWPIRRYQTSCFLVSDWPKIVCWPSTVRCICCYWTLYPKINFQPTKTCLMHTQINGMTVGYISFRWTCITFHSVKSMPLGGFRHWLLIIWSFNAVAGLVLTPLGLVLTPFRLVLMPLGLVLTPLGLVLTPLGLVLTPLGLVLTPLGLM